MKKLMCSLVLVAALCPAAFAGHRGVSFSISFSQPAYVPVCAYPQPVYSCPQPVYVYPAPAYTYVPVQPGYSIGFSTFWGDRGGHAYHGGRGYYDGHRNNHRGWRGHR